MPWTAQPLRYRCSAVLHAVGTFSVPCHSVWPTLGVGWEPVLIETATGRVMVRSSCEERRIRIEPAFFDCWEAQVFRLALGHTPLEVLIREWQLVAREAQQLGIEFRDPVASG